MWDRQQKTGTDCMGDTHAIRPYAVPQKLLLDNECNQFESDTMLIPASAKEADALF